MKSPFKQQIRFHWEKSALRKKGASEGLETPTFKPSLNYVIFRPYYIENEGEVAEIISALGWKDAL